jgi:hypothetical protein
MHACDPDSSPGRLTPDLGRLLSAECSGPSRSNQHDTLSDRIAAWKDGAFRLIFGRPVPSSVFDFGSARLPLSRDLAITQALIAIDRGRRRHHVTPKDR